MIADKDKEVTEWFKINEIDNMLSYQNLKDFWNIIKPKVLTALIMEQKG